MKTPLFLRKYFLKNNQLTTISSQSGFSMIAIFLIMVAMMGAASAVLISTRSNIRTAAQSREKLVSQYAAESAVAYAKAFMVSKWDTYQKWSNLLALYPNASTVTSIPCSYGGSSGLPYVTATCIFSVINNPDDPSGDPMNDTDGKVIIKAKGMILDPNAVNARPLAVSEIEVQVFKENVAVASHGYSAQSHGSSSQNAFSNFDVNAVNFSNSISF